MRLIATLAVIYKLGFINVFANLIYKLKKKLSLFSRTTQKPEIKTNKFFKEKIDKTQNSQSSEYRYVPFSWMDAIKLEDISWSKNYLTNKISCSGKKPWYKIDDFNDSLGDIKGIWEASRFNWAPQYAIKCLDNGEESIKVLNETIFSWYKNNKPFYGFNWKCGQECSLRILNMALTSIILGNHQSNMSKELEIFISTHLERINETTFYAKSQMNNHILTEAAALYVGGHWLTKNSIEGGDFYSKKGERLLESNILNLVANDGTFSQYSTNYHRFVLDIVTFAELWRQKLDLKLFSPKFYQKVEKLISWLHQLTDKDSGGVPNLGSNDGAIFFELNDGNYRDYRYTLQRSSIVFRKEHIFPLSVICDKSMELLGPMGLKNSNLKQTSFHFKDGGYIGIRDNNHNLFVLLNYPNFKFRPSQCDSLHMDLWHNGENLLRDGGTFSYNTTEEKTNYYSGNKSHNNIEFDGMDEMPKLSRFLFLNWSKTTKANLDIKNQEATAEFKTYKGVYHSRYIKIADKKLIVKDQIKNMNNKAVMRWRLNGKDWRISKNVISNGKFSISITSEMSDLTIRLQNGYESQFYYKEDMITTLEVEISNNGIIRTEINI